MNFLKRLRFYLIGFSLGLCMVAVFFGPKAIQCSYFPNSRAMEEAKIYPMSFSKEAKSTILSENIDSLFLYDSLLKKSKITNFGTEEVRATPCRTYRAEYREDKNFDIVFQICKKKTIIQKLEKLN